MKTNIKSLFLLPVLIAALGLMPASRVAAQTFTTLHSFAISDGAVPYAGLMLSGNKLYGTTAFGLNPDDGSLEWNGGVFAVNTDGTGFTKLHGLGGDSLTLALLISSGNTLYGTTALGGAIAR